MSLVEKRIRNSAKLFLRNELRREILKSETKMRTDVSGQCIARPISVDAIINMCLYTERLITNNRPTNVVWPCLNIDA